MSTLAYLEQSVSAMSLAQRRDSPSGPRFQAIQRLGLGPMDAGNTLFNHALRLRSCAATDTSRPARVSLSVYFSCGSPIDQVVRSHPIAIIRAMQSRGRYAFHCRMFLAECAERTASAGS